MDSELLIGNSTIDSGWGSNSGTVFLIANDGRQTFKCYINQTNIKYMIDCIDTKLNISMVLRMEFDVELPSAFGKINGITKDDNETIYIFGNENYLIKEKNKEQVLIN